MIQYQFTRTETKLHPVTNNVIGVVVGLTATDENLSAYVDLEVNVDEKPGYTESEIRNIAIKTALDNDWYNLLKLNIETQKGEPVSGTTFVI